jgi:hypothetical protein
MTLKNLLLLPLQKNPAGGCSYAAVEALYAARAAGNPRRFCGAKSAMRSERAAVAEFDGVLFASAAVTRLSVDLDHGSAPFVVIECRAVARAASGEPVNGRTAASWFVWRR